MTLKLDGSTYLIFEKLINELIPNNSYSEYPCYFNSARSTLYCFETFPMKIVNLNTYPFQVSEF